MLSFRLAISLSVVTVAAWSQSGPTFEVASIKPATPAAGGFIRMGISGGPGTTDPGHITVENMSLKDLVSNAYSLKSYQLTAPDWMGNARFDIVAKVPANTTKEQVPLMWQALLEERFKLAIHQETKELPIFALVVDKGGPKFAEADPPAAPGATPQGSSSGNSVSFTSSTSGFGGGGNAGISVGGARPASANAPGMNTTRGDQMTMTQLASGLSHNAARPVIDQTNLNGKYKISLRYQSENLSATPSDAGTGPTLFEALKEQLGLRLDPTKAPIEFVVVDHIEKAPIDN